MRAKTRRSTYRSDIDGLRAIAVLAVLFFHAGVPGFSGGFVGVDMFFVISGYLITGIILRECRANTFSFKGFYLRRIRRILPALIVMVTTTIILASFVLTAFDFKMLAKNVLATVFMIPNISIWKTSGDYFSNAVDSNPLLHLWSLGVEEQYYLLFPLMLFLLIRYLHLKWLWGLLVVALLSGIGFAFWAVSFKPTFAFYWLPPRAWELLCGAVLAYYHLRQQSINGQRLMTLLGSLMIFLAIVIARNNDVYADFAHQILAVVGITLLIDGNSQRRNVPDLSHQSLFLKPREEYKTQSSHDLVLTRLSHWISLFLSWPLLVGIGRISYSLYLWHWPLFSLYTYRVHPDALLWYETTALLAATFVLAYGSWRYVETPFRRPKKWNDTAVIKLAFSLQSVLVLLAIGILYSGGFPQRFGLASSAYSAGAEDKNALQKDCHTDPYSSDYHFPSIEKCLIGQQTANAPIRFLVWGDSHANAVTPVFDALGREYGLAGGHATLFGHAALWGAKSNDDNATLNWLQFNQEQLKVIVDRSIHDVFLVGRWPSYVFSATQFEGTLGRNGIPNVLIKGHKTGLQAFRASLEETVQRLQQQGVTVWLVLPVPEMDRIMPRWLALNAADQTDVWLKAPYPERAAAVWPVFKELQAKYGVHLLDPSLQLCREDGQCRVAYKGKSVYYDDDHLSTSGSLLLREMLRPAFDAMKQGL
ncbi:putative acyltransferase [Crenothrix polyspora]|uniref:Putative acyltransferase n=1 Tax=Crenothrix polyspora TaxID=360316 RepID=A0A1R4H9N5_9GAMM|nr:acyltransferase family protein [Crenothrix polyspora]SJM92955.1 putative acyltransferase [Crenothrix polyspora]